MNLTSLPTGTRGAVVEQIRRGIATVAELTDALSLTETAVRFHLASLEKDGIVESAGKRKGFRKPIHVYRLTAKAERLYFRAFEPILIELAGVLANRSSQQDLRQIYAEVGVRLAASVGLPQTSDFTERLATVSAFLAGVGSVASVERQAAGFEICGRKCPIGSLVKTRPEACEVFRALIEAVLQCPVVEQCDRSGVPACKFSLAATGS